MFNNNYNFSLVYSRSYDFDGINIQIFPQVGTPVVGGILWYQLMDIISLIFSKKNIIGADIVEMSGYDKTSTSFQITATNAAHLCSKNLAYKFRGWFI